MSQPAARSLLDRAQAWGARAIEARGFRWVTGSDELYIIAKAELPGAEHYGDFPQVENGVGAVAYLRTRVQGGLDAIGSLEGKRIGVVTGTAMAALMPPILESLAERSGATFELLPVVNTLFGNTVTAAGLLPGGDIQRALASRSDLDVALIPAETLNDDARFLDDMEMAALRATLPMDVIPSYDFVDVLSGEMAGASLA